MAPKPPGDKHQHASDMRAAANARDTHCILMDIPTALLITGLVCLIVACAAGAFTTVRVDRLEPKVEEHGQSLARIEYAIKIMERIDRKIPEQTTRGN